MSWFNRLRSVIMLMMLGFSIWSPIPASAAVEYNQRISFVDDFDACSGERVSITGVQHIVGRLTSDASGKLHFGFSRNTLGTGFGMVSGEKYILTDAVARSGFEIVSGQPQTLLEEYHSRFIRRGETSRQDDTIIHFLSKITINANGEMTTSIEIQDVECQ
jgi:hypothetical protein